MYRQFRIRARTAVLLLLLMAGLAGVALLVGKSTYFDRMGTITNTKADSTGSAQQRRELLTRSLEVTLRHPVFGVGPGQFQQVSGYWLQTHNTYTQLSAEAGIPALIIFLIIVKRTFKNLRFFRTAAERDEAWYLSRALYCAMAGYLVGAFFLGTAYWMVPYLLLAYSSVLRRVSETYPRSTEQADSSILGAA
jgi:O-antigen ligase